VIILNENSVIIYDTEAMIDRALGMNTVDPAGFPLKAYCKYISLYLCDETTPVLI
jgi:hypothetical protein